MKLSRILFRHAAACALLFTASAGAASLEVHVTNLRPTKTVRVQIYNSEQSWARGQGAVSDLLLESRAVQQTLRFDGLTPGRYAVRVDQAPNPGGVVEPPAFSFERHGTSGNAGRYGLPAFERAAVDVGPEGARAPIHLFVSNRN